MLNPDEIVTFWDWLNVHDMHLARWECVEEYDMWGNDKHEHVLVPLDMEETEAILDRYLRNVKKVYGDPYAK